jgi:dUTP pyrophosphatase
MNIQVKKLYKDAVMPSRAHHDDAGIDLFAYGDYTLHPQEMVTIKTGCAFEIDKGYVGLIWDKSSIGAKGIKTLGGVVDAGYRGEVLVMLHNLSNELHTFKHGHKVAQLLIQKVEFPEIVEVGELSDSIRGQGGFGSTGK